MLSDQKIAEIRDSVDLVALISEHVPLRRQGARFVGLCPFHTEKSPSFGVSRGKGFYYCFGCHASGDAISFLRHVEGLSFMEAVERLAERAGIEVPRTDDPGQAAMQRARAQRESLAAITAVATRFFEEQLRSHPQAELAREEIARRGVGPAAVQKFRLGYAPASWDALSQALTRQGIDIHAAVEVGLVAPRRNGPGHYDRFRHRLMFPVADQHGRVIAFSGRSLGPIPGEREGQDPPAKYINSPEGPLYRKGQALFGLLEAKVALRKENLAILCEGNFDLVAIHQAGFEHVLAPLGTAFTLDQAKLLRRFVEEVCVVFDGDGAGRKATRAAFDLLAAAGLRARAARLPAGHDPDSFIRERGAEGFRALLAQSQGAVDYLIVEARDQVTDVGSRGLAMQSLGPILAKVESPLERSMYIEKVAQAFDVRDLRVVREELRRGVLAERAASPSARSQARHNALSQTRSEPPAPRPLQRRPTDLPKIQADVLAALLEQPQLLRSPEAEALDGLLTDPDLQAIFRVTARLFDEQGEVDALALLEAVSGNAAHAWLAGRLSSPSGLDEEKARVVVREALPLLEKRRLEATLVALKHEIAKARRSGDEERAIELMRQRDELAKSRPSGLGSKGGFEG